MGFHRTPGSTPGEFAQALESQLPGLIELTRLYYQVRFGGVDLGRNELTRAERLATVIHLAALAAGQPVPVSAGGLDRRVSR
jgi:hypothetical protein